MPTYDYVCVNEECEAYERPFSVHQGINDPKHTECETCKQQTLRRLFGRGTHVTIVGSCKGDRSAHPSKRTVRT